MPNENINIRGHFLVGELSFQFKKKKEQIAFQKSNFSSESDTFNVI